MSTASTELDDDARPAHGMRWGIKTSFIEYLRRMPDGRGSVSEGALPVGMNEVFFTLDAVYVTEPDRIDWSFRGDARFTGHFGLLFVRVAQPRLEGNAESATLTIAGPAGVEDAPRVALVTLKLAFTQIHENTEVWTGTDVTLTAAGTQIFNEVYSEGEPFEPIHVQLPVRSHGN